jgi:excisionase family DNA binding protein
MQPRIDVQNATSGFATATETAQFLHLSRAMVHKLIGEGKVPATRYGRAVRIPWAWLRRQAEDRSGST